MKIVQAFIVTYSYDTWGNLLGTNTAGSAEDALLATNPLRYRGYIYDTETGFYYLQSRYYDPEIGRFINADETEYLGANGDLISFNLYAYCSNNPVNRIDPTGTVSWLTVVLCFLVVRLTLSLQGSAPVECENYTEDDINIYEHGKGEKIEGKINVELFPNNLTPNLKPDPCIRIYDSYKITNPEERKQIIDLIFASELYNSKLYRMTKGMCMREWKAHNIYYYTYGSIFESAKKITEDVDMNLYDRYHVFYFLIYPL